MGFDLVVHDSNIETKPELPTIGIGKNLAYYLWFGQATYHVLIVRNF